MDLLGSILNAMDRPPPISRTDHEKKKKHIEALKKLQEKDKIDLAAFRAKAEEEISKLLKDESRQRHQFDPADFVHRSIIHDAAEVAGLTAYAFGTEGIDRYVMVFKKDSLPCDDELAALKQGIPWDPEKACEQARQFAEEEKLELERRKETVQPAFNYKEKYEHIIGKESAVEAAQTTKVKRQYGFVPSENKMDVRSIEQTMADIRARKRQKVMASDDSSNGPT